MARGMLRKSIGSQVRALCRRVPWNECRYLCRAVCVFFPVEQSELPVAVRVISPIAPSRFALGWLPEPVPNGVAL